MPRGVVIAVKPMGSRKSAGGEDVQEDYPEGCQITIKIEEGKYEGEEATIEIKAGSDQIKCCKKNRGDRVEAENIRGDKDGLHADIVGKC